MEGSATTKRYVVSFLDVLGYSAIVSKEDPDKTNRLFAAISEAVKDAVESSGTFSKKAEEQYGKEMSVIARTLGCRVFSDNITVFCELHPDSDDPFKNAENAVAIGTVLMNQAKIQTRLLSKHSLLCRGGTAIGGFSVQDEFLFGKALVDAYILEEAADTPRMLIERDVKEMLEESSRKAGYDYTEKDFEGIYTRDYDGEFFVRYLSADAYIEKLMSEEKKTPDFGNMLRKHREGLLRAIEDNNQNIEKNRSVRHKYVWAAVYHNEEATKFKGSDETVNLEELFG